MSQKLISASVIEALARTPALLTKLSRNAAERTLHERPSEKEWSAAEIVAHLRANADSWGASITRMLSEDHPTIRYVSPRAALKTPEYTGPTFGESLKLFVAERRKLVATLKALAPKDWSRGAMFTATTQSDQTVLSYAQRIAQHEAQHIEQFERLFAT